MSIEIDSGIPFGNVCNVSVREDADLAEVRFTADPHGGPEALWFCFRLTDSGGSDTGDRLDRGGSPEDTAALDGRGSATAGRRIRIVLEHVTTLLGGGRPKAIRPVVRPEGGDWQRLEAGEVRELADGRVEVTWTVRIAGDPLDIAFCYPYGPADVEALVADTGGGLDRDTIGVTQAGRALCRLSNSFGEPEGKRPGVYVLARQHSGETPGSWVLDGLLRRVVELGEAAPLVWAVPLANLDGVIGGDYGKDSFPYDLNRAWGQAPMRRETLLMQADTRRWAERCRPVLGLDLHAPGGTETDGVYAYLPKVEHHPVQHDVASLWAGLMAGELGDLAAEPFGRTANYASRWNTPNFCRYLAEAHGIPGVTIETPYAIAGDRLLDREAYREVGRRLADCVAENAGPFASPPGKNVSR